MNARLPHGSGAWFHMVGALICEKAMLAKLPSGLDLGLVERYTDGAALAPGLVQGIRFDIKDGKPSYRIGALPDERADITVEVTAAASRELNSLYSADPRYQAALDRLQGTGALRVEGDLARLGDWFAGVHDPIVDNTLF